MAKLTSGTGQTAAPNKGKAAAPRPTAHTVRAPKIITQSKQPVASAASKSVAADEPRRSADGTKRAILTIVGVLFLGFSYIKFQNEGRNSAPTAVRGSLTASADDDMNSIFKPVDDQRWLNPEEGMIEKNFCRGNQTAAGCSKSVLHPFADEFESHGWTQKEYAEYLGWDKYPRENQDRVISETMVYGNKAFKFGDGR